MFWFYYISEAFSEMFQARGRRYRLVPRDVGTEQFGVHAWGEVW
jgi:hypothetical protein